MARGPGRPPKSDAERLDMRTTVRLGLTLTALLRKIDASRTARMRQAERLEVDLDPSLHPFRSMADSLRQALLDGLHGRRRALRPTDCAARSARQVTIRMTRADWRAAERFAARHAMSTSRAVVALVHAGLARRLQCIEALEAKLYRRESERKLVARALDQAGHGITAAQDTPESLLHRVLAYSASTAQTYREQARQLGVDHRVYVTVVNEAVARFAESLALNRRSARMPRSPRGESRGRLDPSSETPRSGERI
jgi:hypothetical protein